MGDYVLATKYSDGDLGDQWAVGVYDCERDGRHYVTDNAGKQHRRNGFRRIEVITHDEGVRFLAEMETIGLLSTDARGYDAERVFRHSAWEWLAWIRFGLCGHKTGTPPA